MRCPRPVGKKRLLCIACTVLVIFIVYAGTRIRNSIEFDPSCEQLKAYKIIDKLCHDYKAGETGGNLCHDLCISQTVVLPKCIAHKNTTIIFLGQWEDHDIVFKTKKEPHRFETLKSMLAEPSDDIKTTSQRKFAQEEFGQVICRDLLGSPHWGQPGLLSQMPTYYDNLLKPILQECSSENKLPWKPDKIQKLYVELHSLMQLALEES